MISTVPDTPPVLVIGGGPAGCAAACTLAALGHPVRLVTRPAAPRDARLAVSIPPSGGKLFDAIGARAAVDAAAFVRTSGNTVWWGAGGARVTPFAHGERGWQAEIGALSQALLDAASEAGVVVERRSLHGDGPDVWRTERQFRQPAFLLDCTGRAGVLARMVGARLPEPDLRSVALVGVWRRDGRWPVTDETHTLIESYPGGWAWSIPVTAAARHVAVMVDPRTSALARGRAVEIYRAELARAPRFTSLLEGATLDDGPWGWDASMYESDRYAREGVLLVGDAGSFVDPLSSAGVRKALVSGWTAAVAVHTSLARPAMRTTALAFFEARERRMYAALRRLARRHLAEAAAGHEAAFWDERHFPADGPGETAGEMQPEEEGRVRDAFERLRRAKVLRLMRGAVPIEPRPAIRGHEIVLEPRIVTPTEPEGVRFISGVDVMHLVEIAPRHADVGTLFDAYCAGAGPVALDVFLTALSTAVARGWLVIGRPPSRP